jgi:hypothetical protein
MHPPFQDGLAAKRPPAVPGEAPFKRELGDPKDRSEGLLRPDYALSHHLSPEIRPSLRLWSGWAYGW